MPEDTRKRDAEGVQHRRRRELENCYHNVRRGSFSSRINLRYIATTLPYVHADWSSPQGCFCVHDIVDDGDVPGPSGLSGALWGYATTAGDLNKK